MHERVPRFLVQPLVENAIKHGVASKADGACIKVKVSREEGFVVVAVADNGPAFPDDLVPGFGLQGIYDKLNILYQGRFELHFSSTPEKQVVVKLLALEK
jgi:sensor histidine kinase YesM